MRLSILAWSLSFTVLAFVEAIFRLGHRALATIHAGLRPLEVMVLVALSIAFVYLEGHLALQRRFVPNVIDRALALASNARGARLLLAPLIVLSLCCVPRREMIRAWAAIAGIAVMVVLVRMLPSPWRGIVDCAVVCALSWGSIALARRVHSVIIGTQFQPQSQQHG